MDPHCITLPLPCEILVVALKIYVIPGGLRRDTSKSLKG